MICIYDKAASKQDFATNGLAVLDECISAVISNRLNDDYSLELIYPVASYKAKYFEELNVIKADGQLFRIYKVERSQNNNLTVKVWARHIFYDLAYFFIESAKVVNANMKEAIEMTIPPEAQAIFSISAPEGVVAPFSVKEVNSVEALFRLIETYGGELERDNFRITIKEQVGSDNGVTIRYGKNIKGLTLTIDTADIATRIYPVGANGLILSERYVEVEGGKLLAFDITKKVEFKDCSDTDALRAAAQKYALNCAKPKVNVNIDFLELSKIAEYEQYKDLTYVSLGDLVSVIHERLGITTTLRVISKQVDLLNPLNTKIVLGDPLKTIVDKLDTSSLLDEITKMIDSNKSAVILKKNSDIITIGTTKYPAMVIGFSTNADANLTCTVTLTGEASENNTLNIRFSLDSVEYDLKPAQKLGAGDNVMGFTLPMPQVQAGSHSFVISMWTSSGTFAIPKYGLQVSIEGLHIEGGLSATIPHIEVVYTFFYSLFGAKLASFAFNEMASLSKPAITLFGLSQSTGYSDFTNDINYYHSEALAEISLVIQGIFQEFSRDKSGNYIFDSAWVSFDSDFDKNADNTYTAYNRATIVEPVLYAVGGVVASDSGAVYSAAMPDNTTYNSLVSISAKLTLGGA
ncbi:MAG: phage tail spike protein [Thermodesulforhabdaceae bacterium]